MFLWLACPTFFQATAASAMQIEQFWLSAQIPTYIQLGQSAQSRYKFVYATRVPLQFHALALTFFPTFAGMGLTVFASVFQGDYLENSERSNQCKEVSVPLFMLQWDLF